MTSGVSEINHRTFALEETFSELLLFHLTDRKYAMGQGISLGSQRLSSCLAEDHLLIVRASLVPLTTINTKSLRALPLRKKHRFSFSFLNLHSLSFIQQLQICNIEDTYFGEVKSNKDFSHNLYFESAHRPPGEF